MAYGAFDIPNMDIEIVMVKLPKGKKCTLVPTKEAVKNGFYGLKDVKLVLEQSLIRTRATLSLNDIVHTWHRGVKFDLMVSSVEPSEFSAVSCINTDIEVDIGVPEDMQNEKTKDDMMADGTAAEGKKEENKNGFAAAGAGRSLMDPSPSQPQQTTSSSAATPLEYQQLPPEPPTTQTSHVCTIQIRNERGQNIGRRRFDTSQSTLSHLFTFAASALEEDVSSFHLATRFPRSVFSLDDDEKKNKMLEECGINEGQMMFFVERR
uniref:UBX domain-containing protein n=1 Tax=Helicotheca tamesis TaxID=374047 RepID=A0A7S2MRN3_9STRA